jgi:transmembrane sensor
VQPDPMATPPKPPFEIPPPPDADSGDPLTREGLAWLLHLNSGHESPEDRQAFETWANWSEAHTLAARRAKSMWEQLGQTLTRQGKPRKPTIPVLVVAALGFSALAFAGGIFGPPASLFADHRSSTGEVRTVTLRDGSRVDLDTGTSFDVSDGGRTITLHTGQVFVTVKPGNATPFAVVAGKTRAEAIGTAYAVRKNGDDARVVVSESAVRVSQEGGTSAGVVVTAGAAVVVSASEGPRRPYSADVNEMMAWRHGELRFTRLPLAEVVAEAGRYRRGSTVIIGSGLGSLPVTGTVDIADVDAFFASLQAALPIKVIRLPGLVTIIRDPSR